MRSNNAVGIPVLQGGEDVNGDVFTLSILMGAEHLKVAAGA